MSRRRPPARRWHIGDQCRMPWYRMPSQIGGWHPGEVVAVRGDHVIVQCYGHDYTRASWEIEPLRHKGLWRRWWSHDKRRGKELTRGDVS